MNVMFDLHQYNFANKTSQFNCAYMAKIKVYRANRQTEIPGGGLEKKWAEFFSRVLRFQQDNYHKGSSLLLDNFL